MGNGPRPVFIEMRDWEMAFSSDKFTWRVKHDHAPSLSDRSALLPPSDAADQSMTLSDLRALCGDGTGTVSLRVNRESTNGHSIRLLPRSGPRGEVMCYRDGKTVARFSAKALLRWINRMEGKR